MAKRNHKPEQPKEPSKEDKSRELSPKIIWPLWEYATNGESGFEKYKEIDSYTFPGTKAICQNYRIYDEASGALKDRNNPQGMSLGIKEFWDEFYRTEDVLFADPYFAPIHYRRMIRELNKTIKRIDDVNDKQIHIYGRNNINLLRDCAEAFKKKYPEVYGTVTIKIGELPNSGIDVHDRFAIMDGEIWHCGAAVGGMHGSLSAVSRGWADKDNLMRKFFMDKGGHVIAYK